jgi:hypothetical protein
MTDLRLQRASVRVLKSLGDEGSTSMSLTAQGVPNAMLRLQRATVAVLYAPSPSYTPIYLTAEGQPNAMQRLQRMSVAILRAAATPTAGVSIWNGTAFVSASLVRSWDGTSFGPVSSVQTWDGDSWVP